MSEEASSHPDFKNYVLKAGEGDTKLTLKSLMPVRMLKNAFLKRWTQLNRPAPQKKT